MSTNYTVPKHQKAKSPKSKNGEENVEEYLGGSIERVTFHSEESGFCVLRVKVRGQRDLVTVVGNAMSVTAGEYVDCRGKYIHDREYGLQFKADELRVVLPSTEEGIQRYLGSGLIKGIGPSFAKRIINTFGAAIFDIIEKTPERLREVPGIGQMRLEKITQSWQEQKVIRDIMVFLQSHGVGTQRAVRIFKVYGQEAIEKVRENPYRLALDIRGIGFKTSDQLAMRLGIPKDSPLRAEAGIKHVLQELCDAGHCAAYQDDLITSSMTLLEMSEPLLLQALTKAMEVGHIIREENEGRMLLFLSAYYRAETGIVTQISRLLEEKPLWQNDLDIPRAIDWVQEKIGIKLSKSQTQAATTALKNKISIITGGPGVGKTTLVNSILKILRMKTRQIILAAPTGRAAKRLSESTGLEAKTLHRVLEFDPKTYAFRRNEANPLPADVIVIDEMSMVDLFMMYSLLRAIPTQAMVIFVGDADQLPSVNAGRVLASLIESDVLPCIRLTEIFRQAARSQIIVNAHRVNKGHLPRLSIEPGTLTDFYFVEAKETLQEKLVHIVSQRIPKRFNFDPIRDIQVLVPMNRGGLGVKALNVELQKQLNPNSVGHSPRITRFGWSYAKGDKVIQLVNNYDKEIFNGDIGFIKQIDEEEGVLEIEFDGRMVIYEIDELDELSLAYATTIHKSQGSEYPAVVLPISMQHYSLLERNLLYTGITRGKSLVVIVGEKRALAMAVRTHRANDRLTLLTERLMKIQKF